MEQQEQLQKKNHIIIQGLKVNGEKVKEETALFLREHLGFTGKIITARTIGYERDKILAQINSYEEKVEIMMNKYKLRNKPIYINNDETKKEKEIQIKLRNMAREKRIEGKEAHVSYKRIKIDGKQYIWNEDTQGINEIKNVRTFRATPSTSTSNE